MRRIFFKQEMDIEKKHHSGGQIQQPEGQQEDCLNQQEHRRQDQQWDYQQKRDTQQGQQDRDHWSEYEA